jgi:hypothetical protein
MRIRMRMRMRSIFGAALVFTLVTVSASAAADDAASAAALKQQGDAAMDALHYTEALDSYSKAYEATHNPALLYNMGRAHEALGSYPEALEDLTSFQQRAPADLLAKVPGLAARIADVRARVSTVSIETSVAGAHVLLGKKEVGVTPLGPIKTNAGHAELEVIAEGYRPFRTELDLVGGSETKVEARLLTKSTTGVLAIRSPAGATVELDGKPAGTVPIEIVVPAGSHPLVVGKSGYKTTRTSVVVAVDETKSVSIPLEPATSVTSSWWFWTGIGAVVLAGVATTFALTTERGADRGTYPPGRVAGP